MVVNEVRCPRHDINVFCFDYLSSLKSFIELIAPGETWYVQGRHMFCKRCLPPLKSSSSVSKTPLCKLLSEKKTNICSDLVRTVNIDLRSLPVSAEKS